MHVVGETDLCCTAERLTLPIKAEGGQADHRPFGRGEQALLPAVLDWRRIANRYRGDFLANREEMSAFLASVERRAFKQAIFAVRDEEAALDLVQDAMLKLTESYSERPPNELPLLFQRILQNAIRDHFRRQKVRSTWTSLFSAFSRPDQDDDFDPLETLEVEDSSNVPVSPAAQLEQVQVMAAIEAAIENLPARQREAFLLRYWEDFDVSETAEAMGCSEGSVKTHCSRAVHALAKALRAKGITL